MSCVSRHREMVALRRGKVTKSGGKVTSRSGLERTIRAGLERDKVPYEYESERFKFPLSQPGHRCQGCGSTDVVRTSTYLPDFVLYPKSPSPVFVEAKGRFTGTNRRRLLAFRGALPGIDLRLVFQRDNYLYKSSKVRYSEWARDHGFPYHVGNEVPKKWLRRE